MTYRPHVSAVIATLLGVWSCVVTLAVAAPNPGSLDSSFSVGTGANAPVYALAQQADGKLLIGGSFDVFNGVSQRRLARLLADGSLDPAFNIGTGVGDSVYCLAVQPNGQIVLGGSFYTVNGVNHHGIARVNADGSVDTADN